MTPRQQALAKRAGLAAVILLAPGGFVLGAALLAERWRKRAETPTDRGPPPS